MTVKRSRKRQLAEVKKKPTKREKKPIIPLTVEQQIMVDENKGLVLKLAKRYVNRGLDFNDLCQEGQFGLSHAVQTFDRTRGYKFSTYALWWIRQAITRAIDDQASVIRLPVHQREKIRKVIKAEKKLWKKLDREPTRRELARAMKMPERAIDDMMILIKRPPLSLDYEYEDGGVLENIIPDDKITNADTILDQKLSERQAAELLECLSLKEGRVIRLRFGIGCDKHTLEQVGTVFGVTRERIRQIEKKALVKLSKNVGRNFIRPANEAYY
jgi:RNA polymerase primary sigma factor